MVLFADKWPRHVGCHTTVWCCVVHSCTCHACRCDCVVHVQLPIHLPGYPAYHVRPDLCTCLPYVQYLSYRSTVRRLGMIGGRQAIKPIGIWCSGATLKHFGRGPRPKADKSTAACAMQRPSFCFFCSSAHSHKGVSTLRPALLSRYASFC